MCSMFTVSANQERDNQGFSLSTDISHQCSTISCRILAFTAQASRQPPSRTYKAHHTSNSQLCEGPLCYAHQPVSHACSGQPFHTTHPVAKFVHYDCRWGWMMCCTYGSSRAAYRQARPAWRQRPYHTPVQLCRQEPPPPCGPGCGPPPWPWICPSPPLSRAFRSSAAKCNNATYSQTFW